MKTLVYLLLCLPPFTLAEDFKLEPYSGDPCGSLSLPNFLNGRIEPGLSNCTLNLAPNGVFYLRSHGGNTAEGQRFAGLIKDAGVTVRVVSYCSSSCVQILAAAKHVEVCTGARIAVHRSSGEQGTETMIAFINDNLPYESKRIVSRILATDNAWSNDLEPSDLPLNWEFVSC